MKKIYQILLLLLLLHISVYAQSIPTTSEQWLQFFLGANPNSINPLERDLATTTTQWLQKLNLTTTWQQEQNQLNILAKTLQSKEVVMLEYLLLQQAFHILGIQDVYEPTMWLVDASKQALASSANRTNPFTALSIPSSENKVLGSATNILNKTKSAQKMSHIERVLRLLATLQKIPQSQQQSILSLFFGQEKSKRILPMVKIADQAVNKYDQIKQIQAKMQELQELVTIGNLTHFYHQSGYESLLHHAFGKKAITQFNIPKGSEPKGMLLTVMASLLVNKQDQQKHLTTLHSIYLHPKVVPLLLEISQEMRVLMRI
ncbi:hypothetical protein PVA45_00960 [Entomospira entomophila]|uniref:Uncharacterized protein n=1 Tax=Entomospira entomophila TaxID=2719988 RepID=A0A968G942_9SPIO|nr:hypothetical protein [Entomospira entomophilus]NIZ40090.1 hypothetical protein [Entomospira entomophilus]WDI35651.1 hypothetical protein PVA45_00960 [Entomospira entomophilus]